MKLGHKIACGVACAAIASAAMLTSVELGVRSEDKKGIVVSADIIALKYESIERIGKKFREAVRELKNQPNMENVYNADRIGALYFLGMYGTTTTIPKDVGMLMWTENFLNDAPSCIDAYKGVGDNNDIALLINKMQERVYIGFKVATGESNKDLGERTMKIFNEYLLDKK